MSAFSLAAAAAVVWGLAAVVEKIGLRGADPQAGVVARTLGVMVGCAVLIALQPSLLSRFAELNGRSRLALMAGGILASVVGQVFFYRALKAGEIGRVAAIGGTWPVVAFVLSLMFLGEALTAKKMMGILLVACGAVLLR